MIFIIEALTTTVATPLVFPLVHLQFPPPQVPSPSMNCFHINSLCILPPPFRHSHPLTHPIPLLLLPPLPLVISQLSHPIHAQSS